MPKIIIKGENKKLSSNDITQKLGLNKGDVLVSEEGIEATVLENGNLEIQGEEVPVVKEPNKKKNK